MKKNILFVLSFIFLAGFSRYALAQSTTTMQDILESVTEKVVDLEDSKSKEVVNVTVDLLVNTGKKTVLRNLDPAFDYNLLAIGDRRISKLRVAVRKKGTADWEDVTELAGSSPNLTITPTEFAMYEFSVTVDQFKGSENVGHFALILYHRNPEKSK